MTTPDILLAVLEFLLAVGIAAILANQKTQGEAIIAQGEMLARMDERLMQLPIAAMQIDIQSNRHKIAQLDKGLVKLGEKFSNMEKRCEHLHRDE